jgi:hypothetical protein
LAAHFAMMDATTGYSLKRFLLLRRNVLLLRINNVVRVAHGEIARFIRSFLFFCFWDVEKILIVWQGNKKGQKSGERNTTREKRHLDHLQTAKHQFFWCGVKFSSHM